MGRNHGEWLIRILVAIFLTASVGALSSCGGGGGGGGGNPPAAKSGDVIWTKTVDPSVTLDDEVYGVAVDATAIYAVGFDSNTMPNEDDQWRIEKRSLSDGALVSSFGSSGVVVTNPSFTSVYSYDDANAIAIDSTFMYVVGFDTAPDPNPNNFTALNNDEWRIEKRSLSTGASAYTATSDPSTGSDEANAIAIDAAHDHMYVVGFDSGGTNGSKQWRIEKRYLSTGLTVTAFGLFDGVITSETSSFSDVAKTIAIDDTYMYVGGYQSNLSTQWEWRTEKRLLSTGETVTAFGTNGVVSLPSMTGNAIISSIAVDAQSVYIVGYVAVNNFNTAWRIEKRDKIAGNLDATFNTTGFVVSNPTSTGSNAPQALVMDADYLYIAGYDTNTPGSKREWRIEKRNKSDGALVTAFATGGVYRNHPSATSIVPGDDDIWAITVDSDYLYVVGYDSVPGTRQWRIEKIVK